MRAMVVGFLACILVTLSGCKPAAPAVDYAPTGTIRDLMNSIVDPSADFLWESVSITVSAKGEERSMPRTDEEWAAVRHRNIALVEAANLLLIPNRKVARDNEESANPDFEREPKDIQAMIANDRATFLNRVEGFREAALKMLAAVDAKDVTGMEDTGEILDMACEKCHVTYWYYPDK